jgi:Probable cobalt transporter subunit (CbtB)
MAHVLAPARGTASGRVLVALVALAALYVMGLDQGRLFSLVQGQTAIDQNLIHEFVHDARHTAGFPCH